MASETPKSDCAAMDEIISFFFCQYLSSDHTHQYQVRESSLVEIGLKQFLERLLLRAPRSWDMAHAIAQCELPTRSKLYLLGTIYRDGESFEEFLETLEVETEAMSSEEENLLLVGSEEEQQWLNDMILAMTVPISVDSLLHIMCQVRQEVSVVQDGMLQLLAGMVLSATSGVECKKSASERKRRV